MDPSAFQARWGALPSGAPISLRAQRLPTVGELEGALRGCGLATVASGDTGAALKVFAAGCEAGGWHLFEVQLDKGSGVVSVTHKCDSGANGAGAGEAVRGGLAAGIPAQ